MIILLSPSKTQDFTHKQKLLNYTLPDFTTETFELIDELRKLNVNDISQLMDLSQNLSKLNFDRYQQFSTEFTEENSNKAILAFKGDVYTDIDVENYTNDNFIFAKQHLRIISGLYGLLKPLDLIQPYRLEMKTKLKTKNAKDLYQFWGDKITDSLTKQDLIINLASVEYFSVINPMKLQGKLINITFKENKNGKISIIAIYAKRARGMMANYLIKNQITTLNEIKLFNVGGYQFSSELSTNSDLVFINNRV